MVLIRRASVGGDTLLIGSDLNDLLAAQQEVRAWVAENDLVLPRSPRRLVLTEGNQVLREYMVLESASSPAPPRGNGHRFGTSQGFVLHGGPTGAA